MDKAAIALAYEYSLPVVVFKLLDEGAISSVINGDQVGTTIS
jgi:uridylate kinase